MLAYRAGAMKTQDELGVPEDKDMPVKRFQEPAFQKSSSGPN